MNTESVERRLVATGFSKNAAHAMAVIQAREAGARSGKIVIRPGRDRSPGVPLVGSPPNLHYLGYEFTDTATREWRIFTQVVRKENVGHTHQGGLALFVVEGAGATVIQGVRYDWEAGDLVLLPIRPGGVHHKHLSFNGDARFLAFWYDPVMRVAGTQMIQDPFPAQRVANGVTGKRRRARPATPA